MQRPRRVVLEPAQRADVAGTAPPPRPPASPPLHPAGLCSITCSLILPTAFYSLLAWPRLCTPARIGLLALLAVSLALATLITAQNVCFMVPVCRRWQQGEQPALSSVAASALGWPQL